MSAKKTADSKLIDAQNPPLSENTAKTAMVLGGNGGLLGRELVKVLEKAGWSVVATGRGDFDHLSVQSLSEAIARANPNLIINTIAYTQVDLAEDEPEQAAVVNSRLPATLGRIVKNTAIKLVHYSTDFVFDGLKKQPYLHDDMTAPKSVYGKTKLAGEQALLSLELDNCCIVRTAWLFGHGKKNFVSTILGLAANRKELSIVADQIGSPTYTVDLAMYSLKLIDKLMIGEACGVYHLANSGQASWCELATEAVRLVQSPCKIRPIKSEEYPQKAPRPAYSVLSLSRFTALTGVTPRPWLTALTDFLHIEDCSDKSLR